MTRNLSIIFPVFFFLLVSSCAETEYTNEYITSKKSKEYFPVFEKGQLTTICVSPGEFEGVKAAAENLRDDLSAVSGEDFPEISSDIAVSKRILIAGTMGKNPWIDELLLQGKIPLDDLKGKTEKFITMVIDQPFEGINSALVIAGSDKRGTIYGIYDLSERIGVSPWYFWADVPVIRKESLFVLPGIHTCGEPKVRYRGIFINDEAPALAGWVHERYGSFNHEFYSEVFELILRMKGNFLWPAMWGRAFYDDDSLNAVVADELGVVIGTSHHEPLMRAHDEWRRYGEGPWNYETNPGRLRDFWQEGIERMGEKESIITVGMRGDGDAPMTEGTAISLLERIVNDQRKIISDHTGKDVSTLPQAWALYKEVQEYYDRGMRVPEDITLLLCDDNWGNIRKLPKAEDRGREGGFGVYYHFDYVGGPRNYKWINTNQIERTWEQMHLAWEYGVERIWIVNVGDIKPMELPIQFFLEYAWNPEATGPEDLPAYYVKWATQQFGPGHAGEIAEILAEYTKYNSRRKPEMLSPGTYSLDNFREAEKVAESYNELRKKAESLNEEIEEVYRDAFFQLVLYPVQACANLNEMYLAAALNHLYAEQGRVATTRMADRVKELFDFDAELTRRYHEDISGGKWNHMMSQTHIGYRWWQEPRENSMPEVMAITVPEEASMGIAAEGQGYVDSTGKARLPVFDFYNDQSCRVEIYNRGTLPFRFTVEADDDWLTIKGAEGEVTDGETIYVSINWKQLKTGMHESEITVKGAGKERKISVTADANRYLDDVNGPVHLESNGFVSVEAENFALSEGNGIIEWAVVPNMGRTGSAVTAYPVNSAAFEPGGSSPHLEYPVYLKKAGTYGITVFMSPTLNFHNSEGRRLAVSMDDQDPVILNIHEGNSLRTWEQWVGNNIITCHASLSVDNPGRHVIKYWLVDPGLVLQKILLHSGELRESYLGPPESYIARN